MKSSEELTGSALPALRAGKLAGSWTLDPDRSQVRFRTKILWGLVAVGGVFRQIRGQGVVAADGEIRGTVTLAAGSLDTGNRRRDDHLRSAAFFAADTHPDITFTADRVEPDGRGLALTGRLTIRGNTRPVSFGAQVTGAGEIRLEGVAEVDRAEFGLDWNPLGVTSTRNLVEIQAVFVRR